MESGGEREMHKAFTERTNPLNCAVPFWITSAIYAFHGLQR